MISEGMFSFASDMYAFAIIVWELSSCLIPYANYSVQRKLENDVIAGLRPPLEDAWNEQAKEIMLGCWKGNPKERMTAQQVVRLLSEGATVEGSSSEMDGSNLSSWTVEQVCQHFERFGADGKDLQVIKEEKINGAALQELTEQELKTELGLPLGIRKQHRKWLQDNGI